MVICYNKGCGKEFAVDENNPEACVYHPGVPIFHDAYKGWSCCKKQTTDFTEFLNISGCTKSRHSDVKPQEVPKPPKADLPEMTSYRPPLPKEEELKPRPSFDSPLETITPTLSPSLKKEFEERKQQGEGIEQINEDGDEEIRIGTQCKNKGCKQEYLGPHVNEWECIHHPGVAIFHEGLKYWSCCKRKTTDFQAFLDQAGCESGSHVWKKKKDTDDPNKCVCRYDWHQTGGQVVVAIYCKNYDPHRTIVKANPIRLKASVFFPKENSSFNLDLELRGIIDVKASSVTMTPTKVEICMKKAEPMSWAKLDIPRVSESIDLAESTKKLTVEQPKVDVLDLSDL
ncbi:cysteine and histidine-rich domain-containing protein 1-like [Artemia franciscana]|uniref:Cysteine and histidine-rich domain-containing protein n=1 Tax=Artemia franciscana TaxID=6661 RepID=A0AA88LKR4_ARTSF|nr:hypothetical protein QYM36_008012 [Artemia franciscana]